MFSTCHGFGCRVHIREFSLPAVVYAYTSDETFGEGPGAADRTRGDALGSGVSTRPESTIRSSCSVETRLKLSSASVKLTSALFRGVSNADPPGARRFMADSKIGASRARL